MNAIATVGQAVPMVAPEQESTLPSLAAAKQRASAEIQAAMLVAQSRPRDEMMCLDRIKTSCQRQGLAELAEFAYSRGGQDIRGASIHLLKAIAGHWGHVRFGFVETRNRGESSVLTFAWDLQTNAYDSIEFTVRHIRHTKKGDYPLTDDRDIYELVANQAARRVRSCLESVIPRDIIEEARQECQATLRAKVDLSKESVAKMVAAFESLGVTREQIEKRIQRRIDAISAGQFLNLRKIHQSITDRMSTPQDWFETIDESAEPKAASKPASVTEQLKKKAEQIESETSKAADPEPETAFKQADAEYFIAKLSRARSQEGIEKAMKEAEGAGLTADGLAKVNDAANKRFGELEQV